MEKSLFRVTEDLEEVSINIRKEGTIAVPIVHLLHVLLEAAALIIGASICSC